MRSRRTLLRLLAGLPLLLLAGCGPSADEHIAEMRQAATELVALAQRATDPASAQAVKADLIAANQRVMDLVEDSERLNRKEPAFSARFDSELSPLLDELHAEVRRIRASEEFGPILFQFTDSFKGVK